MLHEMVEVINRCYESQTFTSLDAMDIDHSIAACVVAGGKRRSSRMSVKNWQDPDIFDFIKCKQIDGKHWSTNISVETDSTFEMAYHKELHHAVEVSKAIAEGMIRNGEPGTWNRSLAQKGEREPEKMFCPNPCGEICLQMWENCCLAHVNMQFFANRPLHKMLEAFRLMTRWLIRATFGDVTHAEQREVMDRNRRIGVGFFGFHGWLALQGIKYSECHSNEYVHHVLKKCRETVNDAASKYARDLGIEQPVKTTAIAPTGTISLLPGVTSGVQPLYARRFKRRVRYADTDVELQKCKDAGYPVERAINEHNTEVVTYYCEDPLLAKVRGMGYGDEVVESQDEIGLVDYLKVQAMLQEHYANNSISFTINIPADKMPAPEYLASSLMKYHCLVKGTTLFPDMSRAQSPIERLSDEQWESWTGHKEVTQFEEECKTGCPVR
jgi:ribonucleoside-triphosphate reductase